MNIYVFVESSLGYYTASSRAYNLVCSIIYLVTWQFG